MRRLGREPFDAAVTPERLAGKLAGGTATRKQQALLTSECKQLKLAGQAASLENLVADRIPDIQPETPLWEETWEAS